jgi:hypothetical protein
MKIIETKNLPVAKEAEKKAVYKLETETKTAVLTEYFKINDAGAWEAVSITDVKKHL